jgi:hypothetical protein
MGVRGVVKREDLPEGRWFFEAHRMAWVSRDGKVIQLGMRLPLRVIHIDFDKRFVDFAVAGRPTTAGTQAVRPSGKPAGRSARKGAAQAAAKLPAVKGAKTHGKTPHTKPAAKVGPAPKAAKSRYANPGKGHSKRKRY